MYIYLEGVYLYPEEQAEFSKKSFVLGIQRLLASARALASDGSCASIAEPLLEADEDHATIRNVFGSSSGSEASEALKLAQKENLLTQSSALLWLPGSKFPSANGQNSVLFRGLR